MISMNSLNEETLRMVRRNKLVGMWAAEKLGLVGESADEYSNDLAMGTLDVSRLGVRQRLFPATTNPRAPAPSPLR